MTKRSGKLRPSGHRSKLEDTFAAILAENETDKYYEVRTIPYIVPESKHKYKIDFTLPNGIDIEVKGYLRDHDERYKYKLIKEQNPDLDLRFVFGNINKLVPGTKITHAQWAEKLGFPYCDIEDKEQIISWIREKGNK